MKVNRISVKQASKCYTCDNYEGCMTRLEYSRLTNRISHVAATTGGQIKALVNVECCNYKNNE